MAKTPTMQPSPAHEARLIALNRSVVAELAEFNADVLRMYPALLAETRQDARRSFSVRPVAAMINGFRVAYAKAFDDKEEQVSRFLGGLSDAMVAYNLRRWEASIGDAASKAGIAEGAVRFAIAQEPGIPTAVSRGWTQTQLALIKRDGSKASVGRNAVPPIPTEHFNRLEELVQNAVHKGIRVEELRKELETLEGVSYRRAEVIGRDQVGKYNGKMTEIRHEAIGVEWYLWRTSGDGRVRDEHKARDGKRFSFKRPPKDGNPGQPVQCRCWAEADLETALRKIEKRAK